MNYLGGKSKIAPWLIAAIAPVAAKRPFWDAFCGGLSVARALAGRCAPGLVSDGNPALIALYQAVAAGWDPPAAVSEEEYQRARAAGHGSAQGVLRVRLLLRREVVRRLRTQCQR